jgi:hypothetical protein
VRALRTVIGDLMDHAPRPVDAEERFDIVERLQQHFARLDWIVQFELRLREEGDVCVGEAFVVPRPGMTDLTQKIDEAVRGARSSDWRLYDLVVSPVMSLKEGLATRLQTPDAPASRTSSSPTH